MRNLLVLAAVLAFCGNAWAGGDAAKGKAISEKVCGACHGVDGAKPLTADNPVLAGQYSDYIVKALRDYKSGKRANPVMKAMAEPLSRKDIDDLATWFSSQHSTLHFQR